MLAWDLTILKLQFKSDHYNYEICYSYHLRYLKNKQTNKQEPPQEFSGSTTVESKINPMKFSYVPAMKIN